MSEALRILFFGDVVGSSGRAAIENLLPSIKKEYDAQLVIANVENAAHGFGLTPSTAKELLHAGVQYMTGGNHIFDKKEVVEVFDLLGDNIIRPANYPPESDGKGYSVVEIPGTDSKIGVINLMGQVFMNPLECPFRAFDEAYEKISAETPVIVVDLHAEATSEKAAMGYHCNGKASVVVGTHTHIQTADERVLDQGTGFITDLGMTGPLESIIGMRKENVLARFIEKRPVRMEVADGPSVLQGVYFEIDPKTGKCLKIERIRRFDSPQ